MENSESHLLPGAEAAAGHSLRLPGLACRSNVVVALEGALGVLVTQQHLVLLQVLDLSVFGNALLVVGVILLYALGGKGGTSGKKGLFIRRCSSSSQSILPKKG